jgi:2-keto-4-pentenoate hydratase
MQIRTKSASVVALPNTPQGNELDEHIYAAARRLAKAEAAGVPCPPVRDLIGPSDVASAYRVQNLFNQIRTHGDRVVGRKIGATSLAVQQQLGVDQPDFGVLYAAMAYWDSDVIPIARLLQPRVEAEIAFMLQADLADGNLDITQCRAAVEYAVSALEIVDSRIANWDISFADTVADNASSGVYVLSRNRVAMADFEPVDVVMEMRIDGAVVSTGTGDACLGDPLAALAWLARRAREFDAPLRAGQLVLSGALGPMVSINAGSTVEANITCLGPVTATFQNDQM